MSDPSIDPVSDSQAAVLTAAVAALLRQFKLEPGLLAGSIYADLHANDSGLLMTLREDSGWTVRRLADALGAPVSTVSSALDRLEGRGLVARRRPESDRRTMEVALTVEGAGLCARMAEAQLDNSRRMLARLSPGDREDLVRLMAAVAKGVQ